MATEQIAVRLPDGLLADLDVLVDEGTYASRAAAVRAGIESVLSRERQLRIDQAIVDGYGRVPPTSAEDDAGLASLREAIVEEPW